MDMPPKSPSAYLSSDFYTIGIAPSPGAHDLISPLYTSFDFGWAPNAESFSMGAAMNFSPVCLDPSPMGSGTSPSVVTVQSDNGVAQPQKQARYLASRPGFSYTPVLAHYNDYIPPRIPLLTPPYASTLEAPAVHAPTDQNSPQPPAPIRRRSRRILARTSVSKDAIKQSRKRAAVNHKRSKIPACAKCRSLKKKCDRVEGGNCSRCKDDHMKCLHRD